MISDKLIIHLEKRATKIIKSKKFNKVSKMKPIFGSKTIMEMIKKEVALLPPGMKRDARKWLTTRLSHEMIDKQLLKEFKNTKDVMKLIEDTKSNWKSVTTKKELSELLDVLMVNDDAERLLISQTMKSFGMSKPSAKELIQKIKLHFDINDRTILLNMFNRSLYYLENVDDIRTLNRAKAEGDLQAINEAEKALKSSYREFKEFNQSPDTQIGEFVRNGEKDALIKALQLKSNGKYEEGNKLLSSTASKIKKAKELRDEEFLDNLLKNL